MIKQIKWLYYNCYLAINYKIHNLLYYMYQHTKNIKIKSALVKLSVYLVRKQNNASDKHAKLTLELLDLIKREELCK